MSLLEFRNITKRFGNNTANDHISFSVNPGEIHALFGENGAGKTTLMNILYGLYQADEGEILIDGQHVAIRNPNDAIHLGIGMVHQHFMLVSKMNLLENILLGLRPEGYPFKRTAKLREELLALSEQYKLSLDLDTPVKDLSVGAQQRGEIIKVLYRNAKIIVFDEPTAVLTPQEVEDFFATLKVLKEDGNSIILISHKMQELMEITDRITVLRDGKVIKTLNTADTTPNELAGYMIGRKFSDESYQRQAADCARESILHIENISLYDKHKQSILNDISFDVMSNEILGIAGVDGNGQKELAEAIVGIRIVPSGKIFMKDENITRLSARRRFEKGIAYVSDDRHHDGLIMDASVTSNFLLREYHNKPFSYHGIISDSKIKSYTSDAITKYKIKTDSPEQQVRLLSGGNQQKLILGRELMSDPKLLVVSQPTRGLDIGATQQMRQYLMSCRNQGAGILLISSDLDEILKLSDRILVIHRGQVMGILDNKAVDINLIGRMMAGETWGNIS